MVSTKVSVFLTIVVVFFGMMVKTSADPVLITTYTNETVFKNALSSFTTHNFDSFTLNDGTLFGQPYENLDQQISGIDFDNAVVFPGGSGGTSNSAPNVVLNADLSLDSPIVFTFDTPVLAVGLFNTSLVDRERFDIFDESDNLLASIELPDLVVNFGGFISNVGIARGEVVGINPTNGSIYIDDLTVGPTANVVPEPSAKILFSIMGFLGLAGAGLRCRWKKKTVN
ncbi:outer membrane protein HofH [Candidatus Scalindua japonica]|uniref:Outer membrane protein HofH n=1 Tax=Candidatus Scalindua japonica TaxID=1284222 RepID=A0A286TU13_9BACT|nr:hypothetical protein [Candidatus Scalindua japonica]GAX59379.1 outer membrane protein HofH [Candidatus Scalindua japonica]